MSDCLHHCRVEAIAPTGRTGQPQPSQPGQAGQAGQAGADTLPDLLLVAAEADPDQTLFYWEHPEHGEAMLGIGCAHDVRTEGGDRFEEANREALATLANIEIEYGDDADRNGAPRFVGGFGFGSDPPSGRAWREFPCCWLFLPSTLWTIADGRAHRATTTACEAAAGEHAEHAEQAEHAEHAEHASQAVQAARPVQTGGAADRDGGCGADRDEHERWRSRVNEVLSMIEQGVAEKVVLSRSRTLVSESSTDSILRVIDRLRRARPGCYTFWIRAGETDFIGSSPELLVARHGDSVETEALAGTSARGQTHEDDARRAARLVDSMKDRREQGTVTRAIAQTLEPVTERLEIADNPRVMALPEAFHLHTPIRGVLSVPTSALGLAAMLHPTPAVCGSPQEVAFEVLESNEADRGWYTGAVGWLGEGGDGRFAVALRSALIDGSQATVWAGAGIVDGSDPAAEFAETEIKMMAMAAAFGETREDRQPVRNIARRRPATAVPGGAAETLIPVEAEG